MRAGVAAVLFDLDGCLVDSAPDLASALNRLRVARGLSPLPEGDLRPLVGTGARGMVWAGFGVSPTDAAFPELRDAFLAEYECHIADRTRVFPGMDAVLDRLEFEGVRWGVVTNKAARFAFPLLAALCLDTRASTIVCGDTTPHAKPHPAPLLEAARQLGCEVGCCVYVGDDLRDVQAANAAGMRPVAAGWGYLGVETPIQHWGAEIILDSPESLQNWLELN